ncbi:MAG: recombination regulator RecX [Gammaproteobacteria bacterium]|nr:recombination regulator RecX [Gammaproteobacteria bacterium]
MKTDAKQTALASLARREHSAFELRRKLLDKGHDPAEIDQVLAGLIRDKLLSDERYTEAYINSRVLKGYGPRYITAALRERGVSNELIQQSVDGNNPVWQQRAAEARRKRFGVLPGDYREKARQMRFLEARGFSAEQIRAVLKQDEND